MPHAGGLVFGHAVLFDAPRFVDQSLEDAPYRVGIEWFGRLAAQPVEHLALTFRVIRREVIRALELTNGKDDFDALSDQFEDAAIQFIDASP